MEDKYQNIETKEFRRGSKKVRYSVFPADAFTGTEEFRKLNETLKTKFSSQQILYALVEREGKEPQIVAMPADLGELFVIDDIVTKERTDKLGYVNMF